MHRHGLNLRAAIVNVEASMKNYVLAVVSVFCVSGCSALQEPPPVVEGPPYQKPPKETECEYVFCSGYPEREYDPRYCCIDGSHD